MPIHLHQGAALQRIILIPRDGIEQMVTKTYSDRYKDECQKKADNSN